MTIHEHVEYPCEKCDYIATQKSILKLHIRSIHEGLKYPCEKCDYTAKKNQT